MPIDISAPISLAEPFDADTTEFLAELQGNLLRGHGRHFAAHVFVAFPSAAAGRRAIAAVTGQVTTARLQHDQAAAFRATGADGGLFTIVLVSSAGYRALGALAALPPDGSFRAGMEAAGLGDPARTEWEATFATEPHAMILLADNDENTVTQAATAIAASPDLIVLGIERGRHLRNAAGRAIEHFGYVDGRSQPMPIREDLAAEPRSSFDPQAPLDQFVVPCPGGATTNSFGSYFVFRKLEQDVAGFKAAETRLAIDLGVTEDLAGAMVVGRFEDGTPLATSLVPNGAVANDFDYGKTADSLPPRQAHIRKTNPRGDLGPGSMGPQMLRRGIPFGTRADDPNDRTVPPAQRPSGGVGLLFMSYQANVAAQFEFMQSSWANNPGFVAPGTGRDPVIGQGPVDPQSWIPPGQPAPRSASFARFVTMKGGAYFFAPCLSTLRALGSGDGGGASASTLTAATVPPSMRLAHGDSGDDVAGVQRHIAAQRAARSALGLRARLRPVDPGPIDGVYGARTRDAVRSWQRILGVPVDGVWGPVTAHASIAVARIAPELPAVELALGAVGDDVAVVQALLTVRAALAVRLFPGSLEAAVDPGGIDGRFGLRTAGALEAWTTFLGLPASTRWDPAIAVASEPFAAIA